MRLHVCACHTIICTYDDCWSLGHVRTVGAADRWPTEHPSFPRHSVFYLSLSLSHIIPNSPAERKRTVASAVQLMLCCQMLGGYCVLVVAVLLFVFHFFDDVIRVLFKLLPSRFPVSLVRSKITLSL